MHRRVLWALLLSAAVLAPKASDAETVADLRAQLSVLNGQVQQLRDELVQRGAAGGLPSDPASALVRLDQLESELRRITDRVDVLTNDLDRVIRDASNRVGDIEFRLDELEGGRDPASAPPTDVPLLGGGLTRPMPRPRSDADGGGAQLAMSEQADFEAASAAAAAGEHEEAARRFASFLETYPGGPLSDRARLGRADSLASAGQFQTAARAYLDAFSGNPQGEQAPVALKGLGTSLVNLGQTTEACLTFTEVELRYPGTTAAAEATAQRNTLACP